MRCEIAELIVEVPEAGGLAPRCRSYRTDSDEPAQIVIDESRYKPERYDLDSYDDICYLESGVQFYGHLLRYDGMYLHASALCYEGKAYLFSGPSGVGKSTHTRQWQSLFGDSVQVFNDDKPALRCLNGNWYAYGTPWCGKDGINQNRKVPLGGICFLQQARENSIRRLTGMEAIRYIFSQTTHSLYKKENMELLLNQISRLVESVPVWELHNVPGPDAALLSRDTLCAGANEMSEK